MQKLAVNVMFVMFVLGVVFPISSADKNTSHFLQAVKNIFHYFPEDTVRPEVKETPTKFKETMKEQLRYPETKAQTK